MRVRAWPIALLLALLLGGGPLVYFMGSREDSVARDGGSDLTGPGGDLADAAERGGGDGDRGDPIAHDSDDPTANDGAGESAVESGDDPGSGDGTDTDAATPPAEFHVDGTVVGADGRSLAGATVELFLHRRNDAAGDAFEELMRGLDAVERDASGATRSSVAVATTDGAGRFSIPVEAAGEYRLSAERPPLARAIEGPFRITERDPFIEVLVVLGGGLSLSGVIETADGTAVGGAEVSLLDRLEGELPGRHYHAHRTVSAPDGTFSFDGLEARRYILTAAANGYARALLPSLTPPLSGVAVPLETGSEVAVRVVRGSALGNALGNVPLEIGPGGEIVLPPPVEVDGAGDPVPGARVYALNPLGFAVATTGVDGIAQFRLPGDDASIRVTADGYREARVRRIAITPQDTIPGVPIGGPTTTEDAGVTVIPIEPVDPIDGVVLRSDGSPAPFAELLEIGGGLFGGGLRTFRADAEGRFSARGDGALVARLDGEVSAVPGSGGGSSATIDLVPTIVVVGRIIRPNGWPAVGAEVRLGLAQYVAGGGTSLLRWAGAETATFTAADGTFALTGVPAWGSQLELVVQADGSPDRHIPVRPDVGEIVLGEEAVLSGRLLTPPGTALGAAALVFELPGSPPVRRDPASGALRGGERVLVASDGHFFIDRLSATADDEPLVLHVVAPPFLEERREVSLVAGENPPLDIELRSGGSLRVVVEDAEGEPRGAAEVTVDVAGSGGSRRGRSGPDGIAFFASLPEGPVEVSVDAGVLSGATVGEIAAGGTAEVIVEVQ